MQPSRLSLKRTGRSCTNPAQKLEALFYGRECVTPAGSFTILQGQTAYVNPSQELVRFRKWHHTNPTPGRSPCQAPISNVH
jgi:hypothetical protein